VSNSFYLSFVTSVFTSYLAVNLQIKFSKFGSVENVKFRLALFIDRCRDSP